MADNQLQDAGSDFLVGTDQLTVLGVANVNLQRTKQTVGEDGVYVGDVGGALVDGHSNRSAMYVRERPDVREFTPTVTVNTAAYSAGDSLGGLITIANVVSNAGNTFRLNRVLVVSKVDHGMLTILLFNDNPSGTTFTDHAAFPTIADADVPKLRWSYIVAPDTVTGGLHVTYASRTYPSDMPDVPLVGTSLYLAIATAGTPDFVNSTDLKVSISGERL